MVQLDMQSRIPLYEQIKGKILEMAAMGVLKPEEQLPSVRYLARELGINPNTVSKAYQELERDGVIYSVLGKGSFISPRSGWEDSVRLSVFDRLKALLKEGKSSGVTYSDILDMASFIYQE